MGRCHLKHASVKKISALFKRGERLNVSLAGGGTGTVLSSPTGINCPPTCSAVFPFETSVVLTEIPTMSNMFEAWSGACSGTALCAVKLSSSIWIAAKFQQLKPSPNGTDTDVISYVFTPDSILGKTFEFALLADGGLRLANSLDPLQYGVMAPTAHGVVKVTRAAVLPSSTATIQSFAVENGGGLEPEGAAQTVATDKFLNLVSDSTYVYALSDEGVFAYQDAGSGLIPQGVTKLRSNPPSPCTIEEENAGTCLYSSWMTLGGSLALFVQSTNTSNESQSMLSTFDRSQGEITSEGPLWNWNYSVPVPTPDGRFAYGFDPLGTDRLFRLDFPGDGIPVWNVLSNGAQIADGFAQVLVSNDGSFLFAVIYDGNESPRIRAFRIDRGSGDLTEIGGSPFLIGQYYFGWATLDPTGRFLLLTDGPCDASSGPCTEPGVLESMAIDGNSGALTVISVAEDGVSPYNVFSAPISQ